MRKKITYILFLLIIGAFYFLPSPSLPQFIKTETADETLEAVVTVETAENEFKVKFLNGSLKNESGTVEAEFTNIVDIQEYKVGDKVVILKSKDAEGRTVLHLVDHVRRDKIYILFAIFFIVVLGIGGLQGISSIAGMAFSFLVLFKFILPNLLLGHEPILISILGCLMIIPVSFYLSHGINKKTNIAVVGTLTALVLTGLLATFLTKISFLSGLASDDASFLRLYTGEYIDFKGLLLAGIIISLLGILDDITISQSAVVRELLETKKTLSFWELYKKSMNVGRDHIASVVNTLILVYAGAALPLFMLFVDQSRTLTEILNYEIVAEEIIQTLVASIGLILAVPITTLLACKFITKKDRLELEHHH